MNINHYYKDAFIYLTATSPSHQLLSCQTVPKCPIAVEHCGQGHGQSETGRGFGGAQRPFRCLRGAPAGGSDQSQSSTSKYVY